MVRSISSKSSTCDLTTLQTRRIEHVIQILCHSVSIWTICLFACQARAPFALFFRVSYDVCVCSACAIVIVAKSFSAREHHSMFAKIHRFIYAYKIDLVFSFAIHSSAVICSVMRKLDSNVCVCWASLWHKFFSPVPPPHHNHRWINDARSECLYMFDNIFSFNYSLSRKTNFSPMHVMTVLLFFNFIHFVFRLLFHFCTSLTKRKSSSLSLLLPPTLYAHPSLLLFLSHPCSSCWLLFTRIM